ncbi:DUF5330 domain-containing protein [Xanthobacteraceae bacterium A53D]
MFFLLRMAFWIGLILLILPIGLSSEGGKQVGALEAFGAVQAAISDARGFCDRQPEACAVGGNLFGHITDKAQAGARWVYETIGQHKGEPTPIDASAAPASGQPSHPAKAMAPQTAPQPHADQGGHGLTPQDLAPAWAPQPTPAEPGMPLPPRRPA